jgi:dGTPase
MKNTPGSGDIFASRRSPREEDLRGPYLRDQTAIIHSLPFRRLKHKTQVFFAPENDHICTRIEHVMHVGTVAATIVRGLNQCGWNLSEEMACAIGFGHDLGHSPFGHSGEAVLNDMVKIYKESFIHEINGLRVVNFLANDGEGLNLTLGVRDGIVCHNGEKFEEHLAPAETVNVPEHITDRSCRPSTFEGCIVRYADKIAYLGRDLEDALEAGLVQESEIPERVQAVLGKKNGEIINAFILDIIHHSKDDGVIRLSPEKFDVMNELKRFNYSHIYFHPKLREYEKYCRTILCRLFEHLSELYSSHGREYHKYAESTMAFTRAYGKYLQRMDAFYQTEGFRPWRMAVDYISGMTDGYALSCMREITLPPVMKLRVD